jgi:hypothetical protein
MKRAGCPSEVTGNLQALQKAKIMSVAQVLDLV